MGCGGALTADPALEADRAKGESLDALWVRLLHHPKARDFAAQLQRVVSLNDILERAKTGSRLSHEDSRRFREIGVADAKVVS